MKDFDWNIFIFVVTVFTFMSFLMTVDAISNYETQKLCLEHGGQMVQKTCVRK